MLDFTKSEKRELRSLAGDAYKIELSKELEKLEATFVSWRKGEIDPFELDERIHNYHSGPRKELWKSYEMLNQPEAMVARGLATGLISRDRVSAEVGEKLAHLIQFFKQNGIKEQGHEPE